MFAMVLHKNYFQILIIVILGISCIKCTEFVPVYMWSTLKISDHVPALHKTSQDSFKDRITEYLKEKPKVIVFAEYTLSPEDFAQRNSLGETAFSHLRELKKGSYVDYRPLVGNPIEALKTLDKPVTEISMASFKINPDADTFANDILIIHLNDAKDDEDRFDMLKRHDVEMTPIYNHFQKKYPNILAIYTAIRTSRVTPDDILYDQPRHLLADDGTEDTRIIFQDSGNTVMMFLSDVSTYVINNINHTIDNTFTATATNETGIIAFTLTKTDYLKLLFNFSIGVDSYWSMNQVVATLPDGKEVILEPKNVFAPLAFSYHCGGLSLEYTDKDNTATLVLPGFQIQPFSDRDGSVFGDAYDCVGFTSVPIWSGLFVTLILLLIMTFGLTMMMDIKTMDRFDDAKGKTITINASE